jgi:large subunit ribosomal protein L31
MRAAIHPTYFSEAQVVCSCGNMFTTGSTKQEIHVEICYKCHPLYTGEKRYVDTLGQVGKFQKKQERAEKIQAARPAPKPKAGDKKTPQQQPKSLRELLLEI